MSWFRNLLVGLMMGAAALQVSESYSKAAAPAAAKAGWTVRYWYNNGPKRILGTYPTRAEADYWAAKLHGLGYGTDVSW